MCEDQFKSNKESESTKERTTTRVARLQQHEWRPIERSGDLRHLDACLHDRIAVYRSLLISVPHRHSCYRVLPRLHFPHHRIALDEEEGCKLVMRSSARTTVTVTSSATATEECSTINARPWALAVLDMLCPCFTRIALSSIDSGVQGYTLHPTRLRGAAPLLFCNFDASHHEVGDFTLVGFMDRIVLIYCKFDKCVFKHSTANCCNLVSIKCKERLNNFYVLANLQFKYYIFQQVVLTQYFIFKIIPLGVYLRWIYC